MKAWISAAVAGALSLSLATSAVAQTKWDMPTPYPDGNFHTINNRQFVDEVAKATGGRLQITIHSNASLLKLPEIKRGVQTGSVQIGEFLVSTLGNEDAVFAFDSVPGLATSYDKAKKLWAAAKPYVAARLEKQGMVLLYSVAWPPQGVYAKKELTALADLKGMKFRAYNPATARFAQILGASPVTIQQAEVPQAFRAGLADAMITSGATGVDTQAWDYLTHYYDAQAFLPQNIVFANKAAFDGLPEADRKAVMAAAEAAEARGWAESEKLNEGFKKTMAEKGIKVAAPTAAMSQELAKVGETMAAEWVEKAGPDGKAIIDAYRK
ncbi:TRAP transporter substrate-binding protein [Prosthecomicrobium sp. N25]|uniref:TRAP transporter substrate-binding protein n=1 Tax=Prosthecomicrobium sp. N25 TaxID=3129254 RepID=UPI003077D4B5